MTGIICLLPVRNGAEDLPAYLDAAPTFCDAIVALDDGSTDETRALLEQSSLVRILLTNPRRQSYRGWHDGENRNRLLKAAADLEPEWVISIDADERIPPDDARALRTFVRTDAVPGCAYGFQHFRMWGKRRYDPAFTWIYRLFAFRPGEEFPNEPLHFDPVPTSIPGIARIRTTLRVQHFGASDDRRRRARLKKYLEGDPERRYRTDYGHLGATPQDGLPRWPPRPPELPVLLSPDDPRLIPRPAGSAKAAPSVTSATGPSLVALLAARNSERDLGGYLDSVSRFADAVVALDDGSTDRTRRILESHPLVKRVLSNPPSNDYSRWDDAGNRNRLLRAAGDLHPDWVLMLDADERIDADDARALRRFVQEADRGYAYGFKVYRMIEDEDQYDRAGLWVYRLFAYEPGQRLEERRQHGVPVPTSIPQQRWLRTTVRIKHLAGLTEERRRARYEKYLQADPGNVYQRRYSHLLDAPGDVRPWRRRPPDLPVIVDPWNQSGIGELVLEDLDLAAPPLSVVVITRGERQIERAVRSVVEQEAPHPFETIVVVSGSPRSAAHVRERFPQVCVVELPSPVLPGAARNAGLRVATGDYVSFPGSHVRLLPGSLAARIRAHERGYSMVTGTILNGTPTLAGWASYFLDHSTALPGRPSGELSAPPAHCSYSRDLLLEVGGFPPDMRAGEDTVVNTELFSRGYVAYRERDLLLVHHSPCRTPGKLLAHHFLRGRALGRIILEAHGGRERREARRALRRYLGTYVSDRMAKTTRSVRAWGGDLQPVYRRVLPLVFAGVVSAWSGATYELSHRPRLGGRREPR